IGRSRPACGTTPTIPPLPKKTPGPPAGQARPRKTFLVHPWPPARHQASPRMPPAPKALEMSDKLIDDQVRAGEHERLRFGRFSSIAKSMAFWAFYTGAIASASIASFSIVRGGRDAKPTVAGIQSATPRGTEAIAVPGSTADRSATIAEGMDPKTRVADSNPAAYRETEAPQRSKA